MTSLPNRLTSILWSSPSSELYATVSIVSGVIYYAGLQYGFPQDFVIVASLAVGFTLRVLAIVFKLEMPKFVYDKDLR